jgi:hypothetical protein
MSDSPSCTYLMVQTGPVEGREDEYNRWYEEIHIPEVLRLPGFVAARRFKLSEAQRSSETLPRNTYLVIYELTIEAREALDRITETASERGPGVGVAPGSSALYWTPVSPRLEASS